MAPGGDFSYGAVMENNGSIVGIGESVRHGRVQIYGKKVLVLYVVYVLFRDRAFCRKQPAITLR